MKKFAVLLSFLPVLAMAQFVDSKDVAPVLSTIKVTNVGKTGAVLAARNQHPFTKYIVAVPATVLAGLPCTTFAGQEAVTDTNAGFIDIRTFGADDAVNECLIAVLPSPIDTQLVVKFDVLTGGFAPAKPIQTRVLRISGKLYDLTLNLQNDKVTIAPRLFK